MTPLSYSHSLLSFVSVSCIIYGPRQDSRETPIFGSIKRVIGKLHLSNIRVKCQLFWFRRTDVPETRTTNTMLVEFSSQQDPGKSYYVTTNYVNTQCKTTHHNNTPHRSTHTFA